MKLKTVEAILQTVSDATDNETDLLNRMEEDYGYFRGVQYTPPDGSYKRIYTDNYPQNTADKIIDLLSKAKLIYNIPINKEGTEEQRVISDTERAFGGFLGLIDQNLLRTGVPNLQEQMSFYSTVRGWIVLNPMIYKSRETKKIETFCGIWDRRWTRYEMGSNGPIWVANIKFLTPTQVEYEYGINSDDISKNSLSNNFVSTSSKEGLIPVVNYFDKENNAIIVGDKFYKSPEPHRFKTMPVIIKAVGATPYIASSTYSDTISDVGESWISNNRNMVDHINFLLTAALTMIGKQVKGAWKLYSDTGKKTLEGDPGEEGSYIPLSKDRQEELEVLEQLRLPPDFNNVLTSLIAKSQEAGLPSSTFGQLGFTLSGLALNQLSHSIGTVVDRRASAMAQVIESMAEMMINQYIQGFGKGSIELMVKSENADRYYDIIKYTKDMVRSYPVKASFETQMAQDDMQKYLMADVARRPNKLGMPLLPDSIILEQILKVPDVKLVTERIMEQMAESDPLIILDRMIDAAVQINELPMANILAMRRQEVLAERQNALSGPRNPQQPTPGSINTGGMPPNAMPPEQANPAMMQMVQNPEMQAALAGQQMLQSGILAQG